MNNSVISKARSLLNGEDGNTLEDGIAVEDQARAEAERLQAQSEAEMSRARRLAGVGDEEDDLRFRRRNRQLQADMAAEAVAPSLWQE